MRRAYDYWQDQPGCYFEGAANTTSFTNVLSARPTRCPHRASLAPPPCPRAGRVFPSTQPIVDDDQCRQSTPAGRNSGLATPVSQPRRFVLPSCCSPRALLSTSTGPSASTARRRNGARGLSRGWRKERLRCAARAASLPRTLITERSGCRCRFLTRSVRC